MDSTAAKKVFRQHRGVLRTKEAIALGIHPRTLYAMRDSGVLDAISRGVFRLASLPPLANPDLVTVALRVPDAVVCLLSALDFHNLTTEVPHEVQIALARGTKTPKIDHPPIQVFRLTGKPLTEGVVTESIDGVDVRIYGPEKCVADSFRFRNRIGTDAAVEALNLFIKEKKGSQAKLLHYARICRVEKIIMPYLEALQ